MRGLVSGADFELCVEDMQFDTAMHLEGEKEEHEGGNVHVYKARQQSGAVVMVPSTTTSPSSCVYSPPLSGPFE